MYRCCIFDLDGTLVNSIYAIQKAVNLTLGSFGLREISVDETRTYVGDGYKKLMERALIACGDEKLAYYEESLVRYSAYFKDVCMYKVEPYEGIPELLTFLKEQNIKIAVLSNKPHARTLDNVNGVFGEGYFDLVNGERESEGIKRKPAPDGVYETMRQLGVRAEECLYFGDTNTDMQTGQVAGVDTVGVTWGFRDRKELEAFDPTYLADVPAQVVEFICEANELR